MSENEAIVTAQTAKYYRRKPTVIEAVQWTGSNLREVQRLTGTGWFFTVPPEDRAEDPEQTAAVFDKLHSTWVHVYDGQWIIKGIRGECYPLAIDVFEATYAPVAGRLPVTPNRIVVAGDWHGDGDWAVEVIRRAPKLLGDTETRPLILHVGDFGIWPGVAGTKYLDQVIGACFAVGVDFWFIDGNHEDFTQLEDLRIRSGQLVNWLPRGYRWAWHGREWLALGGGVSVDKAVRAAGENWWPEEEITDEQEHSVTKGGHADVMVTHDCPAGVTHTYPAPPPFWDLRDIARSNVHQERLQRIVSAIQPAHLMHGHLHMGYQRECDFGYGPVQITGLDHQRKQWNYMVLDIRTMTWESVNFG